MKKHIVSSHELDDLALRLLIHGSYNTGKSYLAACALRGLGERGLYVSVGDEPVAETLRAAGAAGITHLTLEGYEDVDVVTKTYKGKIDAVVVDSLTFLMDMALMKVTGGNRTPGGSGSGTDGRAEWGQIKFLFTRAVIALGKLAPVFIAVCPSDKKVNDVTGEKQIYPALMGDLAYRIGGRFPFVGYMDLTTVTADKVQRRLHMEPMTGILTRCNTAKPFTKPLILEQGPGCWEAILKQIEERRG